jgi:hypothetical protein
MIRYLVTSVLSAFLLFIVQPFIGKVILPWFGGSASVWSTVLLFFQVILLLGYGYSFLLAVYFDRRKQLFIHTGLLAVSLIGLLLGILGDGIPLLPSHNLKPVPGQVPGLRIIFILGSTVGLPYFVLSTTSPLIQSWYAKDLPDRTPYILYALSNAGSFIALLSYPFSIEPILTLPVQAWLWSAAYIVFLLSVGYILIRNRRKMDLSDESNATMAKPQKGKKQHGRRRSIKKRKSTGSIWRMDELSAEERQYVERVLKSMQWMLLSMCTSLLLAAVTNQITQNVAPIPLLWILPLGIYLFSFVVAFAIKASYLRFSLPLFGLATLAVVFGLSQGNALSVIVQISIYDFAFLCASFASHGELARLRPEPDLLTAYYLIIAIGSVLGTVFVSVIAPLVFDSYWEFNLGFLFCWIILIAILYLDQNSFLHRKRRNLYLYTLLVAPVTLLLFTGQYISVFSRTTVTSSRNFYGTLRLQEISTLAGWDPFYVLSHGTTIHGMQFKPSELRKEPIAYFSPTSGVGRLLKVVNRDSQGKRVGILGLGVGTLAAYGREQDVYRFYEIDPDVVELAEGREGYLNYLTNSLAEIDVVLGDARLSLENELISGNPQDYDVLVLDVFSGDAVPVHLMTKECFDIYLNHLVPDGVIAANISTSHINLEPLLTTIAESFDLYAVMIEDDASGYPCCQSRWVLMSRENGLFSLPAISEVSQPLDIPERIIRLWTDDYSNPLQVLY